MCVCVCVCVGGGGGGTLGGLCMFVCVDSIIHEHLIRLSSVYCQSCLSPMYI